MRGVKGSGPYGKKAAQAAAEESTTRRTFAKPSDDDTVTCRVDGAALVNGNCPSCAVRAQRFARIRELEAELRLLKQRPCEICHAPGARKGTKETTVVCPTCRKLLRHETQMKAQLAKAKGRS